MLRGGDIKVTVEFMDGEKRVYSPVGGAMTSPTVAGDGLGAIGSNVVLNIGHQAEAGAPMTHLATIPLMNIREYRCEPL